MAPASYRAIHPENSDTHRHSQDLNAAINQPQSTPVVADILTRKGKDIFSVTRSTSLAAVATELARKKIGAMPVIDNSGELVGIISERDIVQKHIAGDTNFLTNPVSSLMTENPVTCTPEHTLGDVMNLMTEGKFRHVPVLNKDRLCGMISIGDLVLNRLNEIEYQNLKMKQLMVG
ncbi:MAG: CBS domain-containing protein [Cohaesibacteraceae bacterium]|nr:CBS domain-containing protein [Cohaesibacteraceae bacterium]